MSLNGITTVRELLLPNKANPVNFEKNKLPVKHDISLVLDLVHFRYHFINKKMKKKTQNQVAVGGK